MLVISTNLTPTLFQRNVEPDLVCSKLCSDDSITTPIEFPYNTRPISGKKIIFLKFHFVYLGTKYNIIT